MSTHLVYLAFLVSTAPAAARVTPSSILGSVQLRRATRVSTPFACQQEGGAAAVVVVAEEKKSAAFLGRNFLSGSLGFLRHKREQPVATLEVLGASTSNRLRAVY
jgi:hypothetical protein